MLFALWNGGYGSYSPSSAPEDTEVFPSLQAVKDELKARYDGWAGYDSLVTITRLDGSTVKTRTPGVTLNSDFLVWSHGDGTEFPEYGTRVFFGPRGGIRTENF